jgi:hypothetical protein
MAYQAWSVAYLSEFCILQAYQALLRNLASHDITSASSRYVATAHSLVDGAYLASLQSLQLRTHEEVFQASQRMVIGFSKLLLGASEGTIDCFLPSEWTSRMVRFSIKADNKTHRLLALRKLT